VLYTVTLEGEILEERVSTIANNNAKEKAYKDLQALVEKTATDREMLRTYLLTEKETSAFLTEIEQLGVRQGVVLITDSLEVKKQSGLFDMLTVRFTIEGKEELVTKMITVFETLPYHSQIVQMNFQKDDPLKTKSTIELKVTLLKEDV
jgi:hypothetical protein